MRKIGYRFGLLLGLGLLASCPGVAFSQRVEWETLNADVARLDNQGRYSQARILASRALDVAARNYPATDPRVATSLSNLAAIHYREGDYSRSLSLYRQALAIQKEQPTRNSAEIAVLLNSIGAVLLETGRYSEATDSLEDALFLREKLRGDVRLDGVASVLHNLGGVSKAQGSFAAANSLFGKAEKIRVQLYGESSLKVIDTRLSLADMYRQQGRYSIAKLFLNDAVVDLDKLVGPSHPDTLSARADLASVEMESGNLLVAERLFNSVQKGLEERLGVEHPRVAVLRGFMGELQRELGNHEAAEKLLVSSFDTLSRVLGGAHPTTALAQERLARLRLEQGRLNEAAGLARAASLTRRETLGERHPALAASYVLSGKLALAQGLPAADIDDDAERALAIVRFAFEGDHPLALEAFRLKARAAMSTGDHADAARRYTEMLPLAERLYVPDSLPIARLHLGRGEALLAQGDEANAVSDITRALNVYKNVLGSDSPLLEEPLLLAAQIKKRELQEESLRNLLSLREKRYGVESGKAFDAAERLADFLVSERRYVEARPIYLRLLKAWQPLLLDQFAVYGERYRRLIDVLKANGDYAEAQTALVALLPAATKTLGEESPFVLDLHYLRPELLALEKRYAEAEAAYTSLLSWREQKLGTSTLPVIGLLANNLAEVCRLQGAYDRADANYRKALSAYSASLNEVHPFVATVERNFGLSLFQQKRFREAQSHFKAALQIQEMAVPPIPVEIGLTLQLLTETAIAEKEYVVAEEYLAKAYLVSRKLEDRALLKNLANVFDTLAGAKEAGDASSVKRLRDRAAELRARSGK